MGNGSLDSEQLLGQLTAALRQSAPEALSSTDEQWLAEQFLAVLTTLLPNRSVLLRLLDKIPPGLRAIAATNDISEKYGDLTKLTVELTHEQMKQLNVAPEQLQLGYVALAIESRPLLSEGSDQFMAAAVRDRAVVCVIDVEESGVDRPLSSRDRHLVTFFAEFIATHVIERRQQQDLQNLREQLDRLFEQSRALVIVLDRDRRIRLFNQSMQRLTGYEIDAVVGRDMVNLVGDDDRRVFVERYAQCIAGESVAKQELTLVGSEGDLRRTVFSFEARLDSNGGIESVMAVGHDLTELRAVQQQLVTAEKLSQLGQLAAEIVHEFNTPLTSITVYGEYLLNKWRDGSSDEEDIRRLSHIVESARRMESLARGLLDYARNSGDQRQPVSLNKTIRQALAFCEHRLAEVDATIETDLADDLTSVMGVGDQLQQVVINLVTNACDAIGTKGTIRVSTRKDDDGSNLLEVADDGVGMDGATLVKIYEPFYSRRQRGVGTGLGLTIVKDIVDNHRGAIEVDSKAGQGTVFCIRLPEASASQKDADKPDEC